MVSIKYQSVEIEAISIACVLAAVAIVISFYSLVRHVCCVPAKYAGNSEQTYNPRIQAKVLGLSIGAVYVLACLNVISVVIKENEFDSLLGSVAIMATEFYLVCSLLIQYVSSWTC
jgi:hypothetical protein